MMKLSKNTPMANLQKKTRDRDYIFHNLTVSLCPTCLERVMAKVIIKDGAVYLLKRCPKHGETMALVEEDAKYYLSTPEYNKPGTKCKIQTKTERGCPFDCGLCPEHEQHGCIGLIDVTNFCDLKCPNCYAGSGVGDFLSMSKIEKMMDFLIDSEEGEGEILQISGGEPTTHPKILDILKLAKSKPFKCVMLNTNGLRLAGDESFARSLGELRGRFEVYLQFDGFKKSTYEDIRGRDLLAVKKRAIQNLAKYKVPMTLVATVKNGVNDDEIGDIVKFAMETKFIRGVNFQPIAYFGRLSAPADPTVRVTLSGILNRIEKQTKGMLKKSDFVPLPCHPDKIALTYLFKQKGKYVPITRKIDIRKKLSLIDNSLSFKAEDLLRKSLLGLWSASTVMSSAKALKELSCCIPLNLNSLTHEERMEYVDENTFRISVVSFLDAFNFDLKSIKQECVHFVTPDLKKIPFSTYNLLHRN
jgi:uncharacterized radical SAM superfamily Fe-S cluster-containing enzyme